MKPDATFAGPPQTLGSLVWSWLRRARFGLTLVFAAGMAIIALSMPGDAQARPALMVGPDAAETASVRRFALVVGANDGGTDRVPLQYAGSDAHAIALVLKDIGGVRSEDLIELSDPSPAALKSAFAAMGKRLREAEAPGLRLQFVFYYSGHSDETGLMLSGDLVRYPSLRSQIQSTPADVKIAILDSCASGAFTRLKGGKKTAPFLVGSAAKVKGHAFLTSSSADEAAQESDRVGGSFFTHYLTTGLRGAADTNTDKIVTLNEAYEFAFDETLERTEATRGGPQHAAYDIQLAGSGDLVMTDLRRTSARLEIMSEVGGRIFVRSSTGHLAAELYKPEGNGPILLALESGHYQVTVDNGESLRRADITLAAGLPAQLTDAGLAEISREGTVSRGDQPQPKPATSAYDEITFNASAIPPFSINGQSGKKRIRNVVSVAAGWSRAAQIDGIGVALGAVIVDEGAHGIIGGFGATISHGLVEGLQAGQFYNSTVELRGAQSGVVNFAKTSRGAQMGVVNIGRDHSGVQLGIVNVGGKVRGAQLGLVNVADEATASFGLIGYTREHGVKPEVFTSDMAAFNVGIRLGAKYTYTFASAGIHPFGSGKSWLFGLGMGGHFQFHKRLFIDADLAGYGLARGLKFADDWSPVAAVRVMLGYQLRPHVAFFGGPTVRGLFDPVQTVGPEAARGGLNYSVYDKTISDGRFRIWPGFVAGMRF